MDRDKLPDSLPTDVVHAKNSDKYHILFSKEVTEKERYDTICDTFKVKSHPTKTELITIEEANKSSNRMCKNCVNKLSLIYGIESKTCSICHRDNLSDNVELKNIESPNTIRDVREQYICLECIDYIREFE